MATPPSTGDGCGKVSGLTSHRAQSMNRAMLAYKIFTAEEFLAFLRDGKSLGAAVDLRDGYIHLSTAEQLSTTLDKHFAGQDDLQLLAIETDTLGDGLRWEPSRGGALFPHLYRELQMQDVLWTRPITLGPDGHETGDLE